MHMRMYTLASLSLALNGMNMKYNYMVVVVVLKYTDTSEKKLYV